MAFSLAEVVPWGRSYDEYVAMFDLAPADLQGKIIGCGDGPASFNGVLAGRGGSVVSIDPIYVFHGSDIYIYDPAAEAWSYQAGQVDFPQPRHQLGAGMLHNTGVPQYAVMFSRDNDDVYFHDFINALHVTWTTGFPGQGAFFRSLAIDKELIYSFGGSYGYQGVWGWETNYYPDTYMIDPYNPTAWTQLADMPTARHGAVSIVQGDLIYVMGGVGDDDSSRTVVELYDPAADTWTAKTSAPLDVSSGFAVEMAGKFYVIRGKYVLEYNPAADQ